MLGCLVGAAELSRPLPAAAQALTVHTYTADQGLPQGIQCLGLDAWGRLWIGSEGGVCVYNGQSFRTYGGTEGLPSGNVLAVAPMVGSPGMWLGQRFAGLAAYGADQRIRPVRVRGLQLPGGIQSLWAGPGELWLGTQSQGLWQLRFGAAGHPADTLVQHLASVGGHPADSVSFIGPGLRGQLWASTSHGLLVLNRSRSQLPAALPDPLQGVVYGFCRVSDSVAWVGTRAGLLRVSAPAGGGPWRVRRYGTAEGLCHPVVVRVVQDREGRVWANTSLGLSLGTTEPGGRWHFQRVGQPGRYPEERRRDVLVDGEGNTWVADSYGLHQYVTSARFAQYTTNNGLTYNVVYSLAQPRPTELWVGLERTIDVLPLTAAGVGPVVRHLLVPPSRGSAPVWPARLLADQHGHVWVGTYRDGARRYDLRTGRWEDLNQQEPALVGASVVGLSEDNRGRMWLATRQTGLVVYDPATVTYRAFRAGERGLPSDHFRQAYRDRAGRLWLVSEEAGLVRVDIDHDTFRRVPSVPSQGRLIAISEDQRGELWLPSMSSGLLRYNPATGQLRRYGAAAGLQATQPYFVQCDSAGQVWVGHYLGVDVLNIRTGKACSYGRAEGFDGGETNANAVLRSPDGRLWMGTVGGLMLHDPRRPVRPGPVPAAYLTRLRVGLRDTAVRGNLQLPYRLNSLSFDYLGVSLAQPGSVRYRYRLLGLPAGADAWAGPTATTSATYASLPPGAYTFEVQASTDEGRWSQQPAALRFEVATPWWRSWGAYGLYAAALGGLLYGVRRRTRRQERERGERALERQALGHLQALDQVKTDFFTNISHELRTPLTLMLGPAELVADTSTDPASRQHGRLVLAQARKQLALINQLLDLSKLDAGALRLHLAPGDVAQLARQLLASFESLASRQGSELRLDVPAGPVPLVADAAKLDEVLTNLLANALRFTPAGGQVTLRLTERPPAPAAPAGLIELAVQDTGPGIAAEHLPHVFDRFYQAGSAVEATTGAAARQGTGIGLALVRELVHLHGGTVAVQSEPGQGACFVVRLPRNLVPPAAVPTAPPAIETEAATRDGELAALPELLPANPPAGAAAPAGTDPEAAQVLLIEDSDEVRAFIAEALAPAGYHLLLAPDGATGLTLARAEVPDLIVSDVMMPGLSGYEVCAALKADAATSHIPVVLLTARSADDDRLRGLETGAQAYLPKPFRPRELQAQVRSLLHLSQQSRARFAGASAGAAPGGWLPETTPADALARHQAAIAALPSLDQVFIQKLEAAVLAHLGDSTYGVDQLGDELHLSRTQLHRKVKALTGQAPGEYLRQTRLLRALALLQARAATVAEVAYQVGYNSPANFSTAFSRQFGYPPSAVDPEAK